MPLVVPPANAIPTRPVYSPIDGLVSELRGPHSSINVIEVIILEDTVFINTF